MSIIYRSLIEEVVEVDVLASSIWLYDTDTDKEWCIWMVGVDLEMGEVPDPSEWIPYTTPMGGIESDITKQEAEALMFIEAI